MRLCGRRDGGLHPGAELRQRHQANHPDGAVHRDEFPCRGGPPLADGLPGWERCAWDAWDDVRRDGTEDARRGLREPRQEHQLRQDPRIVRDADAGKLADRARADQYARPWWMAVAADGAALEAERCRPDAVPFAAQSCGEQAARAAARALAAQEAWQQSWLRESSCPRRQRAVQEPTHHR